MSWQDYLLWRVIIFELFKRVIFDSIPPYIQIYNVIFSLCIAAKNILQRYLYVM